MGDREFQKKIQTLNHVLKTNIKLRHHLEKIINVIDFELNCDMKHKRNLYRLIREMCLDPCIDKDYECETAIELLHRLNFKIEKSKYIKNEDKIPNMGGIDIKLDEDGNIIDDQQTEDKI